ncbi:MAG: transcriptional repressor [Burkholderiaceae bacterium]|nr:transcriptional repressor [Burkholderiaceae bacterium]MEB2317143.1 Fur family transcriptional regulator [Pseudomonadota bacterium]
MTSTRPRRSAPRAEPRLTEKEIAARLAHADAHCRERGAQLTAQRAEVYELLLRRQGSAKAYDLQHDLQQRRGRVAPTTIYRALEFLVEQGLVHRVDALNRFVACSHEPDETEGHHPLFLVCSTCERTTELHDDAALAALARSLEAAGADFVQSAVEIKGLCRDCREHEHQH